jgi:replicative DNA helicase
MSDIEYAKRVAAYIKAEYFDTIPERVTLEFILKYFRKYSEVPNLDVVLLELDRSDLEEGVYNGCVDLVKSLSSNVSNIEWLIENTENYIQEKAINNAVFSAIEIIDGTNKKASKGQIPELLSDALAVGLNTKVGHDYLEEISARWDHYHDVEVKYPTSLEMFNKITDGGFPKKTLNVVTATTGVGKTAFMCDLTANYLLNGSNVLYITLEMAEHRIAERIDANILDITLKELRQMPKEDFVNRVSRIRKKNTGRLFIKEYPPVSVNGFHFESLLKELALKKGFEPDVICVDYLNLCTSSRYDGKSGANSYTIVKSIAEELRSVAVKHNVVMFSATQLNRSAYGSTDVDMTSISESIGLPATVDSLFALISTEDLEARNQIMVTQMKNRYNDINYYKTFFIGIDRSKMRFFDLEKQDSAADSAKSIVESSTSNSNVSPTPVGRGGMSSRSKSRISGLSGMVV